MDNWAITALLATMLGLVTGSILNIFIYRIPTGKPVFTRPHCLYCKSRLQLVDFLALIGLAFFNGRCRFCHSPISLRFALTEIITALLFVSVFINIEYGAVLIKYLFVTALLITVAFIDLNHYIIPNSIVLAGITGSLIFLPFTGEFTLVNALCGILSVSGFLLSINIASRGNMGMGDVKFGAFMGITLGWPLSFIAVFLACTAAGVTGILLLATGRKGRKDPIPFGPFLALGTYVCFMWGMKIQHLYVNFISGF